MYNIFTMINMRTQMNNANSWTNLSGGFAVNPIAKDAIYSYDSNLSSGGVRIVSSI